MERFFPFFLCVFLLIGAASRPEAKEIDCLECHADLAQGKTVHPAVAMGCATCHAAIDASDIPHKKKNKIARGLSAEQPALCYGCHDKAPFNKKTVHAAVGMGCTGCHNPHASKNPKLIVSPMPDLCYTCHDKTAFSKKTVHPPVASGDCLTCHIPHSGDNPSLLSTPVPDLCIMCHDKMISGKHVLAGYGSGGHPISGKADPSRPGKELSCASCHTPHSSINPFLFTNATDGSGGLCLTCHTKIMVR